ncbi:outer membrane protein assembly factor BamA [Enterobacteriaceae endosymbiont of Donacia provostii]|uniref:outer membrane protein assembly factor BamA n=1 Tax=Enterobacteriaceae endosymbiont of Donacia provostii TaxID=2675781 RepID=UPI001449F0BA|nr:outer membrane protein assembly factor BamA [Enterobacteriaceae endosymbiont of Donacia provostii]QJC33705.1 outer membrane protein assembly factor BamA [Enterobacteriaceae endosymbiont of Donacia provostii]
MILISFKKKLIKVFHFYKFLLIFLFIFNIKILCYANILYKKNNYMHQIIFLNLNKTNFKNDKIYSYIRKNNFSSKKIFNIFQIIYLNSINNIFNIIQNKNLLILFKQNIKLMFIKNYIFISHIKKKQSLSKKVVNIKILFKKNNFINIDIINIIGNKFYKTNFLLNYLNINNKFLFFFTKRKKYHINDIYHLLNKLNNFYINQGYLNFQIKDVKTNISYHEKKNYLTIKIQENKPFFYKKILIKLNKNKYLIKSIKKITNVFPGTVYKTNINSKLQYKITKFLKENGFLNSKIIIKQIINKRKNIVNILININTNKKYYVKKINFLGNNFTKDFLLRNELLQLEGDPINITLIKKTKKRLLSLGYFNHIEILLYKNHDLKNMLNVVFKVDEKNDGFLRTGLGIIKDGSLGFNTILKQNNFIGTGYDVNIDLHKDFYHYYLEIFIMKNHAFFKKINSGIKIFLNSINEDDSFFYNYINKNKGFLGIFKLPINKNIFIIHKIGFIKNKISNIEPQILLWNYLRNIGYQIYNKSYKYYVLDEFVIHHTLIFKNLNSFNLPLNGILSSLDTYFSIPWYSKNRYYKINFNYTQYIPLFDLSKLQNTLQCNNLIIFLFRSNFSYGNGFLGGKYPFYKNFYLGGVNSIRGFQTNSIGPKGIYYSSKEYNCNNKTICLSDYSVGGNVLFNINNELIIPLSLIDNIFIKQIRSSIFLDIGNVIDTSLKNNYLSKLYKISKFNILSQIRTSIGLSFQFRTSFGDIIISFAYPLKKYKMDKIQFFQFNFAQKL